MSYLTESKLANVIDIPVGLPLTELKMGDWVIVSSFKLISPMKITYQHVNLQLTSCSVDTGLIAASNRVFGNLGLAYLALRLNYSAGSPGASGALDSFSISALGSFNRSGPVVTLTTPGIYSWIVANNMQPSSSSAVPTSSSIDFKLSVTGAARLELDSA